MKTSDQTGWERRQNWLHKNVYKSCETFSSATYVDSDSHWDWDALFDVHCPFVEFTAEAFDIHSSLEHGGFGSTSVARKKQGRHIELYQICLYLS